MVLRVGREMEEMEKIAGVLVLTMVQVSVRHRTTWAM